MSTARSSPAPANNPPPTEPCSAEKFIALIDAVPVVAKPYRRFKQVLDEIGPKLAEKWIEGADREQLVELISRNFGYNTTTGSLRRHLAVWIRELRKKKRQSDLAGRTISKLTPANTPSTTPQKPNQNTP